MCIWPCRGWPWTPRACQYREVIQERDILRCAEGQVTFRYRNSHNGKNTIRTVNGAHFLWLVLQHVLLKGFRRSRNFGLLHPNCKQRQRLTLLRMGCRLRATAPCPAGMPIMQPPAQPPLSERPKIAVPVLRRGDGDCALAYRAPGIQAWRGRAGWCSVRGTPMT